MQKFNGVAPLNNGSDSLDTNKKLAISQGSTVSESVETPKTPAEALKQAVELNPENELILIQLDGSAVVQPYAQIWERAERILGGLRAFGLQPGHSLVLQVDTSQDFAPILWSCIMGGFVPVPVLIASDYSKPNQALSRLHNIWQQLDYSTILTTSTLASQVHTGLQLHEQKNVKIATIKEIETQSPDPRLHKLQPDELALLLPSSGTTGKPKLIEINSSTFIYRFLKYVKNQNNNSPERIILSWFPLESISGIFTTLPNGFKKNIYLPAELLIRNPLLWLDTLSQNRVTHAQTTNFILARIIDQLRKNTKGDWDFSSVQKIGIGAEPIVAKTARSFIQLLAPYKLHPNVLRPAYGMTECGPIAGSSEGFSLTTSSDGDRFVEIGKPTAGHSIRIVDQQGCILEEGQIGRIQVIGPSMTSGYYQAPELNRELFTEDGWINTGDLGFLQDGRLTVTGREKEIVIINARNYSCHEIELLVEEVEGVEPSYTAACAIRQFNSETDELVIFFHSLVSEESHLAQLLKQIRRNIAHKLGVNPTYLIPIDKSMIPRTSTGKIQRLQLKERFEASEFDAILKRIDVLIKRESEKLYIAPQSAVESQLTKIWEEVLDTKTIGKRDNFFELGGTSLLAAKLFAKIEEAFNKNLPTVTLLKAPTIEEIASIIQTEQLVFRDSLYLIKSGKSKLPLFFVHDVNGEVILYLKLAHRLDPQRPVYGLIPLSNQECPILHTRISDMAAYYIEKIRSVQPNGPYLLGGLCAGGVLAFEIALQLQAQGQQVSLVALIDTADVKAPEKQGRITRQRLSRFSQALHQFQQFKGLDRLTYLLKTFTRKVKNLIVYEFQKKIWKLYNKFRFRVFRYYLDNNVPLPKFLTNISNRTIFGLAAREYIPKIYKGQIALFRATKALGMTDPSIDDTPLIEKMSDPLFGWGERTTEEVKVYDIPGGHSSMLQEPNVQVLAERIEAYIKAVLPDESAPHDLATVFDSTTQ